MIRYAIDPVGPIAGGWAIIDRTKPGKRRVALVWSRALARRIVHLLNEGGQNNVRGFQ